MEEESVYLKSSDGLINENIEGVTSQTTLEVAQHERLSIQMAERSWCSRHKIKVVLGSSILALLGIVLVIFLATATPDPAEVKCQADYNMSCKAANKVSRENYLGLDIA